MPDESLRKRNEGIAPETRIIEGHTVTIKSPDVRIARRLEEKLERTQLVNEDARDYIQMLISFLKYKTITDTHPSHSARRRWRGSFAESNPDEFTFLNNNKLKWNIVRSTLDILALFPTQFKFADNVKKTLDLDRIAEYATMFREKFTPLVKDVPTPEEQAAYAGLVEDLTKYVEVCVEALTVLYAKR